MYARWENALRVKAVARQLHLGAEGRGRGKGEGVWGFQMHPDALRWTPRGLLFFFGGANSAIIRPAGPMVHAVHHCASEESWQVWASSISSFRGVAFRDSGRNLHCCLGNSAHRRCVAGAGSC